MQKVVSAREHVVLGMLAHRLVAGIQRQGHQLRHVFAQLAQFLVDAPLDLVESQPGEVLVQEISRFHQFRGLVSPVGDDDAVLHISIGCDDDEQDALLRQAQEFNVAESGGPALGRHHHAGKARQVGEQMRSLGDEFLRVVRLQLAFQLADFDLVQRPDLEQRIDKEAVAARRRNPARGRVRAGDEAEFFQVRHDVADAGRAQFEAGKPGKRARTNRLTIGNIALDEHFQQALCPLAGKAVARVHTAILPCRSRDLSSTVRAGPANVL